MNERIFRYRLPLKLQIVSWFLMNKNVGQHVMDYNRLINIKFDCIEINTYELSEFYRVKFINENPQRWADGMVKFLMPKFSRFVYELEDVTQFIDIRIWHNKLVINRTVKIVEI